MALNTAVTDTQWSPNFSAGRPAGTPNVIVIHHWGVDGQQHQKVVNYLCTPRGKASTSAHYVASAGRVTQLVHDYDRAWHAGPSGNPRGIGIECRPEMSDGDFETVAGLVAAIRKEWGNLPLKGHKDFMSTACPGRWEAQLGRLSARADQINGGGGATPAPAPAPASKPSGKLDVDGWLGSATWNKWAAVYGNSGGGVVSSQDSYWKNRVPGITCAEWVPSGSAVGSIHIATMQRDYAKKGLYSGAFDGLIGPKFISAFLRDNGSTDDGIISEQSIAVMNLQRWLNTK